MTDFLQPHRRFNPLIGEWVLVSPQRAKRPWNGKIEELPAKKLPQYDPNCYLCPGNKRTTDTLNAQYPETFTFTNDHPALIAQTSSKLPLSQTGLFRTQPQSGTSKVICYSPSHSLTMAAMSPTQILKIIQAWTHEFRLLGADKSINYVQIFENKGELMGASNPHPHGQIWASQHLPTIIEKEQTNQRTYLKKHRQSLLLDYLNQEFKQDQRIFFANKSFAALVPFWAVWPYETMIIPRKPRASLLDFTPGELVDLALTLKELTGRYDRLFNAPFPYSMGIHQAPTDGRVHPEWQLHFHFYPPLLRSATIKKYFVGYEMLAEPQRDITPEAAAEKLRMIRKFPLSDIIKSV